MTETDPITNLAGVGPKLAQTLARLDIKSIGDLLNHVPRRYEDWTKLVPIHQLRIDEEAVIRARVIAIANERSPRRRYTITRATLADTASEITAIWFNQPFLTQTLRVGRTFFFRGKVSWNFAARQKVLTGPSFEATARILPIYPETAGLSSKQLRRLIKIVLASDLDLKDYLPLNLLAAEQLVDRKIAIRTIHEPTNLKLLGSARRRLAFEELFFFALSLQRLEQKENKTSPMIDCPAQDLKTFVLSLPFTLTDDQRRAAWEIIQDLARPVPMTRLLEGEVGSGKTVVAAFASFVAVRAGYQVAWLAPTEILAAQHHQTLTQFLSPFGIIVDLWTGSIKTQNPSSVIRHPSSVVVGTHALLHHPEAFDQLGLVIIDEQHRFGVLQRAALADLATKNLTPHLLSMTATPIPRTLALALYGNLKVSVLRSRPANRQPVLTRVLEPSQRDLAHQLIRQAIAQGRQAFVICPLIESDDPGPTLLDLDKKSATAEYERLRTTVFPDFKIGLLHGRLKASDKAAVMDRFRAGLIDILVATSVIEVGIDVPNATVMLIESADRFGLAQLHQLRGRVGRGQHPGLALLVAGAWSPKVAERLKALEELSDGFALAERDLALRGPGEFLGMEQSGLPKFRFASLFDFDLMERAKTAAQSLLAGGLPEDLARQLQAQTSHRHLE